MTRRTSATVFTLTLALLLLAAPLPGQYVYVANYGSNDISVYAIDPTTGTLSPHGSPFPAGSNPTSVTSVTVDPTGKFAYAANYYGGGVSGYTIDATSCALTAMHAPGPIFSAGLNPASVAVDRT